VLLAVTTYTKLLLGEIATETPRPVIFGDGDSEVREPSVLMPTTLVVVLASMMYKYFPFGLMATSFSLVAPVETVKVVAVGLPVLGLTR
jgi:hypothetical protein